LHDAAPRVIPVTPAQATAGSAKGETVVVATGAEWESVAAEWASFAAADPFFERNASAFLGLVPAPPRQLVDIGCGEGRFDRLLVDMGYSVIGFDASPSLIALATAADPDGDYRVADAASLPLDDGFADTVVSFQGLHAIRNLAGTCREAYRLLRPGGSFCFAILHPIATAGDYETRESSDLQRRYIVGNYLHERPVFRPLHGREITQYQRPISGYVSALVRAGFSISEMAEITGRADEQPIPMFLHMAAVKRPS
jgi:SAM-dependent methyltransferase